MHQPQDTLWLKWKMTIQQGYRMRTWSFFMCTELLRNLSFVSWFIVQKENVIRFWKRISEQWDCWCWHVRFVIHGLQVWFGNKCKICFVNITCLNESSLCCFNNCSLFNLTSKSLQHGRVQNRLSGCGIKAFSHMFVYTGVMFRPVYAVLMSL